MWVEEILESVNKLLWLVSLSALCGVLVWQVRAMYRTIYDPETQAPRFVTKKESLQHIANQEVKNKEVEVAIKNKAHDKCLWHDDAMQLPVDLNLQQKLNMQRLKRLEHDAEETQKTRDEMNKKLTAICINTEKLIARYDSMAEDIRELKDRRSANRSI